ncbi:MAG: hypothetical protein WB797_09155 [Nocardioides sp.]
MGGAREREAALRDRPGGRAGAGRVDGSAAGSDVPRGALTRRPIWDGWDGKAPLGQVRDAVAADAAFLELLDTLSPTERDEWRLDLFGEVRDLADLLRLRSSELVLHTWDISVTFDPGATLPEPRLELVVGNLLIARYTGQRRDEHFSVEVRTTAREHACHVELGPRWRSAVAVR